MPGLHIIISDGAVVMRLVTVNTWRANITFRWQRLKRVIFLINVLTA